MDPFFIKLEPINSAIPSFVAKATPLDQPPPGGGGPGGGGGPPHPVFPIWGPPGIELPPGAGYPPVASHPLPPVIPPVEPPPTPPDVKLVWLWTPQWGKWTFGYQSTTGAGPKEDDEHCEPPAPPGYTFAWAYSPQMQGWFYGYQRLDQAGPK